MVQDIILQTLLQFFGGTFLSTKAFCTYIKSLPLESGVKTCNSLAVGVVRNGMERELLGLINFNNK